jgi:DNA-binding XRE family transcriptional regulator
MHYLTHVGTSSLGVSARRPGELQSLGWHFCRRFQPRTTKVRGQYQLSPVIFGIFVFASPFVVTNVNEDPDQIIQEVGYRVAELRRARGLTQVALAEKLGLGFQSVQHIERGTQNLTIRTMTRLSAALGVSMMDLLDVPALKKAQRSRKPVK